MTTVDRTIEKGVDTRQTTYIFNLNNPYYIFDLGSVLEHVFIVVCFPRSN
jgi:hypothetical protein